MYDLTSFLTTIAAASSSIVAILGGLIASKLISLNNDRAAALERLKQVREELEVRTAERKRLQKENNEFDALDFIRNHISDLMNDKKLNDIYDESEHPSLQQDELLDYWEKAREICSKYYLVSATGHVSKNNNHIPKGLAREYFDDDFGYNVCLEIASKLQKVVKEKERERRKTNNELFDAVLDYDISDLTAADLSYSDLSQYLKNSELIAEQNSSIKFLEFQRDQVTNQVHSLQEPKGMKSGLGIFVSFAIACIIFPLAFIPFSTENFFCYLVVKFVFLGIFLGGLITIFVYLVHLLKWDEKIE